MKKVPTDITKSKLLTEPKTFIKRTIDNGFKTQNNTYKKAKVTKIYPINSTNTEYKTLHFTKKINNKTENKDINNIYQNEKKNNQNIKEFTLEENNKNNWNKELTPSLNKVPLNFSVLSPTSESKEENKIHDEPNLRKSKVIHVLIRTQERTYREKIIINVNKDDNSKTIQRNQRNLFFNFNNSPSKNNNKKPDYKEFYDINNSYQKGKINRRSLIN